MRSDPPPAAPRPGKSAKPAKPYPDFPLFPHAAGVWAKKIRGRMHYFGPWDDPDAALKKYLEQKDDLHAGRRSRPDADAVTVKDICNSFLHHKQTLVDGGELSPRTWHDYKEACNLLVRQLGKRRLVADLRPDDFTALREWMAGQWGLYRLAHFIQYIRGIFKYAYDAELVEKPVRFGLAFKPPSQKTMRVERSRRGPRLFTPDEVRKLIEAADPLLRVMVLLGINCGFGNNDCGALPLSALDLERGWVDYPRPKTGLPRRCALWPETVAALREALAVRPRPNCEEYAMFVFLTKTGLPWAKTTVDGPISRKMAKLLQAVGINGRSRLGFYALRHTFRTVADGAKDQPAADLIMGHEVAHMSSVYREGIDDERLKAVAEHVRAWLFPSEPQRP
jgi:integrase